MIADRWRDHRLTGSGGSGSPTFSADSATGAVRPAHLPPRTAQVSRRDRSGVDEVGVRTAGGREAVVLAAAVGAAVTAQVLAGRGDAVARNSCWCPSVGCGDRPGSRRQRWAARVASAVATYLCRVALAHRAGVALSGDPVNVGGQPTSRAAAVHAVNTAKASWRLGGHKREAPSFSCRSWRTRASFRRPSLAAPRSPIHQAERASGGYGLPGDPTARSVARRARPGAGLPKNQTRLGMELRQIHYFVTVAEELHFGHAADREHIVQSALSLQVQRLERELGVRLLERDTHHVKLTAAGAAFLAEARQILAQARRAAAVARAVAGSPPMVRVGILDASYDSMPQILAQVQYDNPELVIHQVEAGEPEEYRMIADGRLDVGVGRPTLAPKTVASRLFRRDRLGILVSERHRFTHLADVPVGDLASEPLIFTEETRAPNFNQFVCEMCRLAGFTPHIYAGTVASIRAASELVARDRCVCCVPFSCTRALPGTTWRPLIKPASYYPWSVLWRSSDAPAPVRLIIAATEALSRRLGWLPKISDQAKGTGPGPQRRATLSVGR